MLRQQHVTCEGIATFPGRDDERGIDLQPERLLAFADLLRRTGHSQSPPNNALPRLPHYTPRALQRPQWRHFHPYAASPVIGCRAPKAAICRDRCARDIGCFGPIAATPAAKKRKDRDKMTLD